MPGSRNRLVGTLRVVATAKYSPHIFCALVLLIVAESSIANPIPAEPPYLPGLNESATTIQALLANNTSNSTQNDLYVIRAVVYEIGILTDVDNSTNDTTERHEEVNLSFYDPPHQSNGLLDLSGLPVPKVVAPTDNQ